MAELGVALESCAAAVTSVLVAAFQANVGLPIVPLVLPVHV